MSTPFRPSAVVDPNNTASPPQITPPPPGKARLSITEIFGTLVAPIAEQQRVNAIQELPFHGDLWTFTPGVFDAATGKGTGTYALTDKGKKIAIGGGIGVAALAFLLWRK